MHGRATSSAATWGSAREGPLHAHAGSNVGNLWPLCKYFGLVWVLSEIFRSQAYLVLDARVSVGFSLHFKILYALPRAVGGFKVPSVDKSAEWELMHT